MTQPVAPPSWIGHLGWADVATAATVLLAAMLLLAPAIQHSRHNARLIACQDNLRQLGMALTQYSRQHEDYFPSIPAQGPLAAAGIYAPTLLEGGFLQDAARVLCPDSGMAAQNQFRVPSLTKLQTATIEELDRLRRCMGGSYGYCLGYIRNGAYSGTKNLHREHFALMADAPSPELSGHQSPNHGGQGQNVLFEDGHVAYLISTKVAPDGDDIFTNDDGLMAAGVQADDSVIGPSNAAPIIFVSNHR